MGVIMGFWSPTIGYLELGGSTMWIQMVIATVVTVPFFLRDRIGRALGRIRRWRDAANRRD